MHALVRRTSSAQARRDVRTVVAGPGVASNRGGFCKGLGLPGVTPPPGPKGGSCGNTGGVMTS